MKWMKFKDVSLVLSESLLRVYFGRFLGSKHLFVFSTRVAPKVVGAKWGLRAGIDPNDSFVSLVRISQNHGCSTNKNSRQPTPGFDKAA